MCGIAGLVNCPNDERLAVMTDLQAHRGPDDQGVRYFPEESVGLGHRRLSIIDLSPAGHQPMSNDDESIWITFNGEIYNFNELRTGLEQRGHRFKSKSDTEVIIRLYEQDGADCVKQLNGMFALAILDRRRKKLLLARDHFGIKPLYYYSRNGQLAFASEIKGILASGIYSPDINWQGLYDYFTYLYVPSPQTIFRDIQQLPPAHLLELDLESHEMKVRRFWHLPRESANGNGKAEDYEGAKAKLRELLSDSVRRQMVADVPVGVFLSGGVDSPILTGLMAETSRQPVKTFTVVFQGKNVELYNEQAQARATAEKFGTDHHEIEVDISQPVEMLNLIDHFDQPFGNPTFYLMYLISRAARTGAKVALCGAGGDELFAGYPRYRAIGLAKWARLLPQSARGGARRLMNMMADDFSSATLRRGRQFVDGLDSDFAQEFVNWTYFLREDQKRSLLVLETRNGGFLRSSRIVDEVLREDSIKEIGNRALAVDLQTFLPDNILEYTDKMSMAVSLEVRVPYLDYRVVEHSMSLPFRYKLRGRDSKVILKEAFADLLPTANAKAPKRGFNFPLAVWMRDYFDKYFDAYMGREEMKRQGILDWEYIQLLRAEHRAGKNDNSYPLFSLIMFDIWYRKYISGAGMPEISFA
ncbi:MAG: Asparagine synthase [Acidobacteria bacterium]|nr:Asparagine synthase [Acidobacteriota bacterium]